MTTPEPITQRPRELPEELNPPAAAPWVCDSEQKAIWTAMKIAAHFQREQAIIDAATRAIDAYSATVNAWADMEAQKHLTSREFLEHALEEYAEAQRKADPKLKTLPLPGVTVRWRKMPPKWEYDAAALVEHYRGTEVVKVTESLVWGEIKKRLATFDDGDSVVDCLTGRDVPTVVFTPGEERRDLVIDTTTPFGTPPQVDVPGDLVIGEEAPPV